jgi:hypothetical protein
MSKAVPNNHYEGRRKDGNLGDIVPCQLFVVCWWLKKKIFEKIEKNISGESGPAAPDTFWPRSSTLSGLRLGLRPQDLLSFPSLQLVTAASVPLFITIEHHYIHNP